MYDFQNHPEEDGDTEIQAEIYKAGISMSILSKDFNELGRYAKLSLDLEERYADLYNDFEERLYLDSEEEIEGQDTEQAPDDWLADRRRDHALAWKNYGIAQASLGRFAHANWSLERARNIQERRLESELDLPNGSEERYYRDLFEIYYHSAMVLGRMRSNYWGDRQKSVTCFKEARDASDHLPRSEAILRYEQCCD
ncbi:hypothetical protein CONLIGDRAFT_248826 [Coniochaeta ligniaria NRRL 30616]|uniref:Uncharacterized protein n=1 Tax=Coniochaeta ligniaria NRRL 30616 TaxID=1408157 RepID=A0A1J7IWX1_9PEZI|nr:hypothetical protein CONLIGDRAFT_248826 [Coniochaeta ligniaria NRRL 30616]